MIVMDYHAILLQLGITPNYKGYHQMLTALEIVEANPEALTMVTKWLYPAVAKRHQTNWKQVERNLRIAVRTAWGTNRDFLQKLSPLPVKKRPTVSQFISILLSICFPQDRYELRYCGKQILNRIDPIRNYLNRAKTIL